MIIEVREIDSEAHPALRGFKEALFDKGVCRLVRQHHASSGVLPAFVSVNHANLLRKTGVSKQIHPSE
jgi:hypothetical protein